MKIINQIVRVFIDGEEKKAVMFSNGHHEIFLLKRANNDQIDLLLGVDTVKE